MSSASGTRRTIRLSIVALLPISIARTDWVGDVVRAFADAASAVDSRVNHGVTSDAALAVLRPALTKFGFEI